MRRAAQGPIATETFLLLEIGGATRTTLDLGPPAMLESNIDPADTSATPTSSDSASTNPSSGSSDGMDVMNILADVEKHIQRIKTAQKEHDQELNTLESRFEALKNAEREVEQRRKQVIEERGRLEQVQNALREERAAFEKDCQSRQAEFASEREAIAQSQAELATQQQEINERFRSIEQQFAELSALEQEIGRERASLETESQQTQTRHKQLIKQLDERQAELDQRDAETSEQRRAMEAREKELNAEVARMQSEVEAFEARATEAEASASQAVAQMREAEAKLEERSLELAKLTEELGASSQALTEARAEAERQQQEFEQEREQAAEMMSELEAAAAAQKTERETLTSQYESLQSEHESLRESNSKTEQLRVQLDEQVSQLSSKLAQRDKSLAESQEKLKLAGAKLAEFGEVLREQASQLEHAAASKVTIRQQQQEIEHLCNELARYRLAADPEVIDRKDQRIAELTEALRQARGQSPADEDTSRLEQQTQELLASLDEKQMVIEQLQVQLDHAQQHASAEVDAAARDASESAKLNEQSATIEKLTAEVHRLETELSERVSDVNNADETNAAYMEELQALRSRVMELESVPSESTDSAELQQQLRDMEAKAAQSAQLQERINELEHALKKAQSKSDKGGSGSSKNIDEKVQRIRAAAEHLQRRRARLQRLRHLIELHKPADGSPKSESTAEQIELAQQSIAEARSALAMSEREMMKKWARSRSMVGVAFATIMIAVLAAGAWFSADHFFPPKAVASVTLEARTKTSGTLTGDDGAQWSQWHAEMLNDRTFRSTLAKRMVERQLPQYGTESAIDSVMKNNVTVDAVQPGEITITMADHDAHEALQLLDTMASTLSTVSAREAGKRTDGARTVVRGETGAGGATQFASLTGVKLDDERPIYAAIIFGSTLVVVLVFSFGVYSRLVRSKRIFEEEGRLA